VSADLPAVREFEGVVSIAKSQEEWVAIIDEVLRHGNTEQDTMERTGIAEQNSWAQRAETVTQLIGRKIVNTGK